MSLLMLVALSLIGLSATQIALQEEKSARNERDRQVALQAAEAALADAERDIESGMRNALFAPDTVEGFAADCNSGPAGLYLGLRQQAGPEQKPVWQTIDVTGESVQECSVPYGRFTGRAFPAGAGPLPALAPRYVIELLPYGGGSEAGTTYFYRITAVGIGAKAATQVALQTLYRKAGGDEAMPAGRLSWREISNWKELRDVHAP